MARALWKGMVTFGLVNIPVELHTAAREHRPRFRLLHRKDLTPIRMERVCQKDGRVVAWQDVVKGVEIEPGHFVALTEDDFKTAAFERSRSLDILAFVPADKVDARYWDTPYLAVPGKGAEHSYALLTKALDKSGRIGIAKYVMRARQHLAALVPVDGQLVVATIRFQEELVPLPKAPSGAQLPARELALASKLIDGMASDWEPSQYTDDYVQALERVIKAKAEGVEAKPAASTKTAPKTNVVDLVSRLTASLSAVKKHDTGAEGSKKKLKATASRSRRAKRSTAA